MTKRFPLLLAAFILASPIPSRASEPTPKPEATPDAGPSRADSVDKLYGRLARASTSEESAAIIQEIDEAGARSDSDTAALLMSRAAEAMSKDKDVALKLFDAVVDLYPDWARGWSGRATVRFASGNVDGAMSDLAQTLKRDPRNIAALAGLGAVLFESGDPEDSLRVCDIALALAPAFEPLKEARRKAQASVWARSP